MTSVKEKAIDENLGSNLVRVLCIRYPINFEKKSVLTFLDLGSVVNAVHLAFAKELGLSIRPTDIRVQKIDTTTLETYRIVVASLLVEDKANWVRFFEESFLVANISPELILGMSFFTLSDADVNFTGRELQWRTYTTKEALSTIRYVELVGMKELVAIALDSESETFVVHVTSLSSDMSPSSSPLKLDVHHFCRPQVSGLIAEEVPIKIPAEYSNFANVFSPDWASELLEHTRINNHAIELVNSVQPSYGPIYSLGPVELETVKRTLRPI